MQYINIWQTNVRMTLKVTISNMLNIFGLKRPSTKCAPKDGDREDAYHIKQTANMQDQIIKKLIVID